MNNPITRLSAAWSALKWWMLIALTFARATYLAQELAFQQAVGSNAWKLQALLHPQWSESLRRAQQNYCAQASPWGILQEIPNQDTPLTFHTLAIALLHSLHDFRTVMLNIITAPDLSAVFSVLYFQLGYVSMMMAIVGIAFHASFTRVCSLFGTSALMMSRCTARFWTLWMWSWTGYFCALIGGNLVSLLVSALADFLSLGYMGWQGSTTTLLSHAALTRYQAQMANLLCSYGFVGLPQMTASSVHALCSCTLQPEYTLTVSGFLTTLTAWGLSLWRYSDYFSTWIVTIWLIALASRFVNLIWALCKWLFWVLFGETTYRSSFSHNVPPSSRIRDRINKVLKSEMFQSFKASSDNPHGDLALDRRKAINAAIDALATLTGMKVFDICGIFSRYISENRELVNPICPRDLENHMAYLRGFDEVDNNVQWVTPGQEIRPFAGPGLLSLCDWHYTVDQICTMFQNFGGIVITIPFVSDGREHILGNSSYVAGQLGVVHRLEGGKVYAHGFHRWADGSILVGQHALLQAHFIVNVGHLRVFYLVPFAGEVKGSSCLETVAGGLGAVTSQATLVRNDTCSYSVTSSERSVVLHKDVVRVIYEELLVVSRGVVTDAAQDGIRNLLRLQLTALARNRKVGVEENWSENYDDYMAAARYEVAHNAITWFVLLFTLNGWRAMARSVTTFLGRTAAPLRFIARQVNVHAVNVVPLAPQVEGCYLDESIGRRKDLYKAPRPSPVPTTVDAERSAAISGQPRDRGDKPLGKSEKQGDVSARKSGTKPSGSTTAAASQAVRKADSGAGTQSQQQQHTRPKDNARAAANTADAVKTESVAAAAALQHGAKPEEKSAQGVQESDSDDDIDLNQSVGYPGPEPTEGDGQFDPPTRLDSGSTVPRVGEQVPAKHAGSAKKGKTQTTAKKGNHQGVHKGGTSPTKRGKKHLSLPPKSDKQAGATSVPDRESPQHAPMPLQGADHRSTGQETGPVPGSALS